MMTIRVTFYDPASGDRRIEDFSGYDHEDSSEVFGELCKKAYEQTYETRETIESIVLQNNWLENFDAVMAAAESEECECSSEYTEEMRRAEMEDAWEHSMKTWAEA